MYAQEYYEEEDILALYQGVVEKLLLAVNEEDEQALQRQSEGSLLFVEQGTNVWPPWVCHLLLHMLLPR